MHLAVVKLFVCITEQTLRDAVDIEQAEYTQDHDRTRTNLGKRKVEKRSQCVRIPWGGALFPCIDHLRATVGAIVLEEVVGAKIFGKDIGTNLAQS